MTSGRMKAKDPKALIKLREQMVEHFARLVASGWKFTAWRCTRCRHLIPHSCPKTGDVGSKGYWDSATTCLSCGNVDFVRIWPTGRTEAQAFSSSELTKYRHVPVAFEIISKLTLQ